MHLRNALISTGLVCAAILASTSIAQTIPNGTFEQWTGGDPVGWQTSNSPPTWTNVVQSSSAHGGSSAAQGTVVNFSGIPVTPSLLAGTNGNGIPINTRPEALHCWYKFAGVGGDGFSVSVVVSKNSQGIGAGMLVNATAAAVYREFIVNIAYVTGETPDTAEIAIAVFPFNPPSHFNSVFTVDDLTWGPASDVKGLGGMPHSFALEQNYPNPFNPTTNIEFQIPKSSFVSLKVYDVLGREVATLVNEELTMGKYRAALDGATLPSGTYFYRLEAGNYSATKRLLLVK
ncbi:MAG: T9SS type A sorting domain-containing protein [Ignavibacteriae bacterium]|nr:T9SS type A sorting domain-containing protein [Ignavibacteriota bacterium]